MIDEEEVEYEGWAQDLIEDQIAMIRDLSPLWVGYKDPVCQLEVENIGKEGIRVPAHVTFIIKVGEGDGSIANWTLDIESDGIPEY